MKRLAEIKEHVKTVKKDKAHRGTIAESLVDDIEWLLKAVETLLKL